MANVRGSQSLSGRRHQFASHGQLSRRPRMVTGERCVWKVATLSLPPQLQPMIMFEWVIDTDALKIPDTEYDARITMPSSSGRIGIPLALAPIVERSRPSHKDSSAYSIATGSRSPVPVNQTFANKYAVQDGQLPDLHVICVLRLSGRMFPRTTPHSLILRRLLIRHKGKESIRE